MHKLHQGLLKVLPQNIVELFFSFFLGILGSSLATKCFWKILHTGGQSYSDLVTGYIIWTDDFKNGDFQSVLFFLIVAFVLIALVTQMVRLICLSGKIKPPAESQNPSNPIIECLDLACAQFFGLGALWIVRGTMPETESELCLSISLAYGVFIFFGSRKISSSWKGRARFAIGPILCAILSVTALVAVTATVFIFSRGTVMLQAFGVTNSLLHYTFVFVLGGSTLFCILFPEKGVRTVALCSLLLQLFCPFLLSVYGATVINASGAITTIFPNRFGEICLLLRCFVFYSRCDERRACLSASKLESKDGTGGNVEQSTSNRHCRIDNLFSFLFHAAVFGRRLR